MEERERTDETPDNAEQRPGEEADPAQEEGRRPPAEDLDEDPAYNPDNPIGDYKGG